MAGKVDTTATAAPTPVSANAARAAPMASRGRAQLHPGHTERIDLPPSHLEHNHLEHNHPQVQAGSAHAERTEGEQMTDPEPGYPQMIVAAGHVEPCPRRVRATLGDQLALDSTQVRYGWEWPGYPQFFVPRSDVRATLSAEETTRTDELGTAVRHGISLGDQHVADAAWVYGADAAAGVAGTVRIDWSALSSWYEEDEQVFVHPRNPYTRVDALRSTREVRIELAGHVLAESRAPVLVFETGLPTRYYLDPMAVDRTRLVPSDTVSECPYKGRTTGYWSVDIDGSLHPDLAWCYDFPTRQLLPIAGLICFYNERVDITVDGVRQATPTTPFS